LFPSVIKQQMQVDQLFSVKNKVVLVTGGNRGIGRMIASAFIKNNCTVYISSRKREDCDKIAQELTSEGLGKCYGIPADLSKEEDIKSLVQELSSKEKHLNVLVNNAGASWGESIDKFPASAWDKVMNLNVRAVFLLTKELLPLLSKAATKEDPSRIINITSIAGISVSAFEFYPYATSKAALDHLTRMLASHLSSRHITVNAIAPGTFDTKMSKWILDNWKDVVEKKTPLGRIGKSEDIAGACLYLSSNAGSWITGIAITVDGGYLVNANL